MSEEKVSRLIDELEAKLRRSLFENRKKENRLQWD